MTFAGLVMVLALLAFAALIAMRLVPLYMESYYVGSILSNLSSEARFSASDRRSVRETFARRLSINDVDSVDESDLEFTDVPGGTQISVEYETRSPLIANLDVVARFHKTAVLRN